MIIDLNFFIVISIATGFLVGVEVCKRKFSLSSSITRRISHIGAALIAAVAPVFLEKNLFIIACLGFAIFMFISRKHSLFLSIHNVNRSTLGEVFLPLGEALSAAIFLPHSLLAFQFGVLVMGFADAFAGFVGDKYGTHQVRVFGARKSVEGSFVFFLTTLFLTISFASSFSLSLFLVPIVLTFTELFLGYGTDNLAIPAVGSFMLILLNV